MDWSSADYDSFKSVWKNYYESLWLSLNSWEGLVDAIPRLIPCQSTYRPNMTTDQVIEWFSTKLNRPPEAADIYKFGKSFFELGAYSRAQCCLQTYVSTDLCHCEIAFQQSVILPSFLPLI